jgi:hypothetical protein
VQTLLVWKSNNYYTLRVCVCSLSYPACKAHVPYCQLWPDRLYNVIVFYLINGTILGEKNVLDTKCVSWFSLRLLSGTFLVLRKLVVDKVNMELELDATITVLLTSKISSTCFGQNFTHLQERKTETFITYGTMSCYVVGRVTQTYT